MINDNSERFTQKFLTKYSEKFVFKVIIAVSLLVVLVVAGLIYSAKPATLSDGIDQSIYFFPKFNAFLNGSVSILLSLGVIFISRKKIKYHQICMMSAFVFSIVFLVSYIIYHYSAPESKFGDLNNDGIVDKAEKTIIPAWRFTTYYVILITHIVLATIIVPMALLTITRIYRGNVAKHKKLARYTFPIWLYVSITGVVVYLMISPFYPIN
ncbi:MAG: DUF420 domain-containing protein [Bacteroidota bacterium]|nr:DUF420 domain-containing protein [Bacteroidota bacterium]